MKWNVEWKTVCGSKDKKRPTRLSPFSFVMLGFNPRASACSKISIWPLRAASNSLAANARASGGNWSADAGGFGGAESILVLVGVCEFDVQKGTVTAYIHG